jgi:hypothetical protein
MGVTICQVVYDAGAAVVCHRLLFLLLLLLLLLQAVGVLTEHELANGRSMAAKSGVAAGG